MASESYDKIYLTNTLGKHNKFYELYKRDEDLGTPRSYYLIRRWGRIGTNGQIKTEKYTRKRVSDHAYNELLWDKQEVKGYTFQEISEPVKVLPKEVGEKLKEEKEEKMTPAMRRMGKIELQDDNNE